MERKDIWKLGTLFLAGMAVGLVSLNLAMSPSGAENPDLEVAEKPPEGVESRPVIDISTEEDSDRTLDAVAIVQADKMLENGDKYFLVGNYAAALHWYRKYLNEADRRDASLLLRTAMCLEQESKLAFAIRHYQAAAAQAATTSHQAFALAGLARVFTNEGDVDLAIELLANQAQKLTLSGEMPELGKAQLSLEWARALEARALAGSSKGTVNRAVPVNRLSDFVKDLSVPGALAEIEHSISPDQYLALIDQPVPEPLQSQTGPTLGVKIIQRPTDSAESISLSISTDLQLAVAILAQTSNEVGLDIQLSEQAKSVLKGRSKVLKFDAVTLGAMLDRLLIPYELAWYQSDKTIFVLAEAELEGESKTAFQFDSTGRAYRRHELEFPESQHRAVALMSRGRLAIARGELGVANNMYQEFEQLNPRGELRAKLYFNQAQLELLMGRPDSALPIFYKAVDQTLDANLAASSYCFLSGLHLNRGETAESTKAAGRALTNAVTARQKSVAALNQARAYLFERNPVSANATLFRNREYIEADRDNVVSASILGAYAHGLALTDKHKHRNQNAIIRMVTAAAELAKSKDPHSFADYYFASLAYSKLGLHDLAMEMHAKALAQPDIGAWQRVLTFEFGVVLADRSRDNEALATLGSLTQTNDAWRVRALIKIAEIQATKQQNRECIGNCELVLASNPTEIQKQKTLELLGRAYQNTGEHHIAALCFAGMLPAEY